MPATVLRCPEPRVPDLDTRGSGEYQSGAPRALTERKAPRPAASSGYARDAELASRAAAGDRAAQREVFDRLRAGVHRTLFRLLGSNEHMEDLVQEAFIELFRSLGNYRGEALLTTWADRVTARIAYHHLRRLPRRIKISNEPVPEQLVASTEEESQHREGVTRLYQLLERLGPDQRIAFALFELDGRSLEEVAAITGATLVAVKNRVARARRKVWETASRDSVLASYLGEDWQTQ
jgi:RNA polymerase sigma-70 factor, ECF subfamily